MKELIRTRFRFFLLEINNREKKRKRRKSRISKGARRVGPARQQGGTTDQQARDRGDLRCMYSCSTAQVAITATTAAKEKVPKVADESMDGPSPDVLTIDPFSPWGS